MKKPYQQLNIAEREKIQELLWEKKSLRAIADYLGRNVSTISRELSRNSHPERKRYTPHLAEAKAKEKIQQRGRRPRLKNNFIREYVHLKLKLGWSPEQIAGRLPIDHPGYVISPEAIYLYVYSTASRLYGYSYANQEDLRPYLRRAHKFRRWRPSEYRKRSLIPNRIGIEQRPLYINQRKSLGHWEGDSIVSRKSLVCLNTLVERKSRLVKITKLPNTKAVETRMAVVQRLYNLPARLRQTLTLDNGHENIEHHEITKQIGLRCYFANPYHSWERGTNENTNGLIRWYLPKGTDFAKVTKERIRAIEATLNTRPRKCLNYQTPLEVFIKVLH